MAVQPHPVEVPYRTSELSEVCGECREPAAGACRRCQRPLCADHLPAEDRRCATCEAQFAAMALRADSEGERVKSALVVTAFGLLVVAGLAATTLVLWDSLAVILMVLVILGVPLAHVVGGPLQRALAARRSRVEKRRMRTLRRHFLAEHKPLAPLPDSSPSREEP